MSVHAMRLVLGLLFLLLGVLILARRWVMPDLDAKFNSLRMNLGGVLALVFAGLNLARWYAVWSYRRERATPVRTPLQPDPTTRRQEPPNPDFDFTEKK
jgi:hypothetical protein